MRFYTKTRKHYYGIDLHAKKMFACILYADRMVLLNRNIATSPEDFLRDINRFESVQDFASYCRLVKCLHESAGKLFPHDPAFL